MVTAILLALAIIAVGMLYAVLPVVAFAYRRTKGRRTVLCPETGHYAIVNPDAGHAALTAAFGQPQVRIADCSRWPERRDCGQNCLRNIV